MRSRAFLLTTMMAAMVGCVTPAQADPAELNSWCAQVKQPSSIALCSDPELRQLAIDRNHAFEAARARLSPEAYSRLLREQKTWVRSYSAGCGIDIIVPPTLPLQPEVLSCLKRAGQARVEYLRNYVDGGARPGQPRVIEQPPPSVPAPVPAMAPTPNAFADSNAMSFSYKNDNLPGLAMEFRLIHATGVFVEHTADQFRLFVQQNNIAEAGSVAATVIINSNGGSVAEALDMGQFIRQMGFDTEVDSECYSACTIAFLGGVHRYVDRNAMFGVHRVSSASPLDSTSALDLGQISIVEIAEYAEFMGIGTRFVSTMMEAGPNEINLLSHDQLSQYEIITKAFSTQWEIKVRDGYFYLLSATRANNGYHKMMFICDGKGGLLLGILYNATGKFQENVLKWTKIYELDIDGKEFPLPSNEIVGRVQPSSASYLFVTVHVSPRIYSLLASTRILGFKMLPSSRMIYAGWDSDFASGHDKFIEYTKSCELGVASHKEGLNGTASP